MARMPEAKWLGEHSPRRPMVRYDRIILHTIVGRAPVHTPHFSVAGDGTIYQSRDTKYQSGVSLQGNPTSIGIEAEDMGPLFPKWNTKDGHAVPGYTDAQIEAIARICAWAHKTHGVPLELCPNSKPGSRGLAYHRQGIDGNFGSYAYPGRVAGGELWSEAFGKACPGDRRIAARPRILKRAREIAGYRPATEEDEMTPAQMDQLIGRLLDTEVSVTPNAMKLVTGEAKTEKRTVRQLLTWAYARATAAHLAVNTDKIADAILRKLPAGSVDVAAVQAAVEKGLRDVLGSLDEG